MDGVPGKVLAAAELLKRVRRAGPHGKFRFADLIAKAVETTAPASTAATPEELAILRGVPAVPHQGEHRARLLAHQEILVHDASGSVVGLATNVAQATFELNEIFAHALRFDVAKALLELYLKRWPKVHSLSTLHPFIMNADGPRDGFRDDKKRDLQIVSNPGATVTFVVVCGIRHAFGIQLNVLHHCCLAQYGANVIYLRDLSENMYLTGIDSLGGMASTLAQLRECILSLGTQKLVFVGNSGGVFGALYYGALLKADEILLFAGPTSLDIGFQETERQAYPRLNELRRAAQIEWPDLREIYQQNGIPVSLYFGNENRVDRLQAENLAGLPNVGLHPVASRQHFILDNLARIGELDRIFATAAGVALPATVVTAVQLAPVSAPAPQPDGAASINRTSAVRTAAAPKAIPPVGLVGMARKVARRVRRFWR